MKLLYFKGYYIKIMIPKGKKDKEISVIDNKANLMLGNIKDVDTAMEYINQANIILQDHK